MSSNSVSTRSGKRRGKTSSMSADCAGDMKDPSANEKILRQCHELYAHPNTGLIRIGASLGLNLLAPRRKIVVMLIGNHSAGKSSFINWYVGEQVQKTGVAIETQGFTFITSGKKRESLTGKATMYLFPHYKALEGIRGVVDYISTEISPSKARKFSLVTFVDTPGLVDGDVYYPYDVDKAIQWLGDLADQIYVFFDPIGQALCKRTLNIVELLNARWGEKMRFYLSKADEAGTETDRQKVMMQIVQELCKRPGLNKCGFDMPTVYIPDNGMSRPTQCVNQIDDICEQIDKTINYTVQNTLNTLEKDSERVLKLINKKLNEDNVGRSINDKFMVPKALLYALSIYFVAAFMLRVVHPSRESLAEVFGSFTTYASAFYIIWDMFPNSFHIYMQCSLLLLAFVSAFSAIHFFRLTPTISRKERKRLLEMKDHLEISVKSKKASLYQEYLSQCINDNDF